MAEATAGRKGRPARMQRGAAAGTKGQSKGAISHSRHTQPASTKTVRATGVTRRSQEERSSETRLKLIDATLDVLHERGYARTTTADIADLAGVSRGALNHHFESKDDLVAQAASRMLRRSTDEISALAGDVKSGVLGLDAFLDRLWVMFQGQLFFVTLEYVTEARHNPWLHGKLVPLVKDFHAALDAIWHRFFEGSGLSTSEVEATLNATLCLIRGMGVQSVLRQDPRYFEALLAMLKRDLAMKIGITNTDMPCTGERS